jgi:murein DD-endopeptidase MepM/ murein hydrolase activator NlpD
MKISCNSFFDGKFNYLDLNHFYFHNKDIIKSSKNPKEIQNALEFFGYDSNTFGGYGENRKDVWKNTYLDATQGYIHLGIDINVRCGTPIEAPFDAIIVDSFKDTDTKIGWGGRIILEKDSSLPLLVLAHIDPTTLPESRRITKGQIIGKVGTWPTNGNTFNHLHVQCINHRNFKDFDGYGYMADLKNNPNPFLVEF